jgi:hypothetical protein
MTFCRSCVLVPRPIPLTPLKSMERVGTARFTSHNSGGEEISTQSVPAALKIGSIACSDSGSVALSTEGIQLYVWGDVNFRKEQLKNVNEEILHRNCLLTPTEVNIESLFGASAIKQVDGICEFHTFLMVISSLMCYRWRRADAMSWC